MTSIRGLQNIVKETGTKCSLGYINEEGVPVDGICLKTSDMEEIVAGTRLDSQPMSTSSEQRKIGRGRGEMARGSLMKMMSQMSGCPIGDINCMSKTQGFSERLRSNYRPPHPEHVENWLSSKDIGRVMSDISKIYRDFRYVGMSFSDWDAPDYHNAPKSYNYRRAHQEGARRFAIVFNTALHGTRGEHWVLLFAIFPKKSDTMRGGTFYYNSLGREIPKKIKKYITDILTPVFNMFCGNPPAFEWNRKEYQEEDVECGMYVLNTIFDILDASVLKNQPYANYAELMLHSLPKISPDSEMQESREWVFS